MRLLRHGTVTATIVCQTNTRIGGAKESFEIGGQDNPVIRHPISLEPYIPGSSLKGKLRSLLETKGELGANVDNGRPCGCGACGVCILFGRNVTKGKDQGKERETEPTRLIFRDAPLSPAWRDRLAGEPFVKFETAIHRKTGMVQGGSLRNQEYIPAGAAFDFEVSVRLFEGDDPAKFQDAIRKAIDLLEKDYLGGSGTRGYGKVKFENLRFEGF